jgi:hypothetical protein
MIDYEKEFDKIEQKIERVEYWASLPNSAESRSHLHGQLHSALKLAKISTDERLKEGWALCAEIIIGTGLRLNPNWKPKK